MIFELQTGLPIKDGEYLVYVPSAAKPEFLEPHIVLRVGTVWRHRFSTQIYLDAIAAWIGPLRPLKLGDVLPGSADPTSYTEFPDEAPSQEYDL